MPRKERIQSQSNIYHVMTRGNERKSIFKDEEDRERFAAILRRLIEKAAKDQKEKKFSIYAYCLMDNHVHLIVNQGEDTVSRIMKRIGASYVHYFNKKYSRTGHLFQDRFKSEPIENDGYLIAAVRYVHNNPVKAGLTNHASRYKWSSYNDYSKENTAKSFIDTEAILGIFSVDRMKAIELFRKFNQEKSEDAFIEHNESYQEKAFKNQKETESFIIQFLHHNDVKRADLADPINRENRTRLIIELRRKSNLSIRQIAESLNLGRGVVQRVAKRA